MWWLRTIPVVIWVHRPPEGWHRQTTYSFTFMDNLEPPINLACMSCLDCGRKPEYNKGNTHKRNESMQTGNTGFNRGSSSYEAAANHDSHVLPHLSPEPSVILVKIQLSCLIILYFCTCASTLTWILYFWHLWHDARDEHLKEDEQLDLLVWILYNIYCSFLPIISQYVC